MTKFVKLTALSALVLAAFNAAAVQQDITVTADVDATVSVTKADGTPLPDAVEMGYRAGVGLTPYRENIKFWSNAADRALNVSLGSSAQLRNAAGTAVPLSVSINGTAITTTAASFAFATTFPGGIANGSSTMPLEISQTTLGVLTTGQYSGVVSLIVTQATATATSGS